MRVAVLGCGYVGLALCRQLVDDHEVVGVRRSRSGLDRIEATGSREVKAKRHSGRLALAGLYGPDRFRLERYLDGPVTEGYRNTVHRDDVAGAVPHALETVCGRGEVVDVVDDEPASKWSLGDWLAEQCGRDPPSKRRIEERLADEELSAPV